MTLTNEQRIAWLRLIRSENVGAVTFRELINHFGSAAAALDTLPTLARRGGKAIRISSRDDAERELAAVAAIGAQIVTSGDPDYPPWLRFVPGAPPLVTVRGNGACLARPTIAVVGSRNASIAGRKFAMQIAAGLGEAGFTVASGLARGIDAAAHAAALATGTVAVFAGGLDRPYPPENVALGREIVERGGSHMTEMPMGWEPRARDFPRRNRVISGISVGVVVIEAAFRSGSLITARLAAEQGRLVFAVPGSPLDPRTGGTNQLIKDGANMVTSVDDIITEIEPMLTKRPALQPSGSIDDRADETGAMSDAGPSDRDRIVNALGATPTELDEIIRFTGLTPAQVRLVIIELAVAGRLEHHPGGRVSLIG